jgi:hypothetical protein
MRLDFRLELESGLEEAMSGKQAKQGIPGKAGKRKGRIVSYYALRYPYNKLKRILKYNGMAAARSWADKKSAAPVLLRLIKEGAKVREA